MKTHPILTTLASISLLTILTSCTTTDSGSGTTTASQIGGASAKPYPLDTCLVTGNKLGSMGDPVRIVHNGQEMKFCCRPCVKKFNANPDKYLSQLN